MPAPKPKQENPLVNIFVNVLIPVLILSYMSKDPDLQKRLGNPVRLWDIGPVYSMLVALALPLGYGIWTFYKTRKWNFFSALGLVSVLLTGGLTLYLWNKNGSVKPHAGLFFGLKEALIPAILCIAFLASFRTATPLLQTFLYNDSLFDVPRIEQSLVSQQQKTAYHKLLWRATCLCAASFLLSAVLNLAVALWFFRGFDHTADGALETYNKLAGSIIGWSFLIIGVPVFCFLFLTLRFLQKNLRTLTGLRENEIMVG